jgi:hypothetical protein
MRSAALKILDLRLETHLPAGFLVRCALRLAPPKSAARAMMPRPRARHIMSF